MKAYQVRVRVCLSSAFDPQEVWERVVESKAPYVQVPSGSLWLAIGRVHDCADNASRCNEIY